MLLTYYEVSRHVTWVCKSNDSSVSLQSVCSLIMFLIFRMPAVEFVEDITHKHQTKRALTFVCCSFFLFVFFVSGYECYIKLSFSVHVQLLYVSHDKVLSLCWLELPACC